MIYDKGLESCVSVEISDEAFYNMIRTAVEVYPREGSGNLFGKLPTRRSQLNRGYQRKRILVRNAYPMQTTRRMPKSVKYGDDLAVARLRSLEHAISANGLPTNFIGGYHSHPKCEYFFPSQRDSDFIEQETGELNRDHWLEIILAADLERNKKHEFGEHTEAKMWYLETHLWYSIRHGYHIKIGAFLFAKNGNWRQLRIKKMNRIAASRI